MRNGRIKLRWSWSWWWAFALLIAAPALALAILGLRAAVTEKLERLQRVSEQQTQLARLADLAIGSWLGEIEAELRNLEAAGRSDHHGINADASSRLLSDPSAVLTLTYNSGTGLAISNQRIFFGDETASSLFPRWSPITERLIHQAQAAEAQSRLADAARHYQRIAADERRLSEWANLALARISRLKPGEQQLSYSEGLSPTGVPVALIATSYLESVSREERRHLDVQLRATLDRLRSGRWWLNYDERRFYDAYILQLLQSDGVVMSNDPVLDCVAEIERAVRAAPPLKRDGPSLGYWPGDSRWFLIAWLPSCVRQAAAETRSIGRICYGSCRH